MSEWASEVLGSLCDFCAGSAFPKSAQGLSTGDYPFIKVSDMNSGGNERCITESNNWVSESERRRIKAKLHPAGAVAFAKIGVALTFNRRRILGRPTIIDNNMMSAVPRESAVDRAFFYYLLRTVDFNTIAAGTALPYLNVSDLRQMPVQIPPLPTQRRIAHILGTLDDKIELNRRMNRTLEKMAAAIFKSWFIDFDPVHAKADGRDTGLPAEIADLFPAAFEDSDLGPIPKGWTMDALGEHALNFDSKRVPVSGAERAQRRGPYPYHGAAAVMDYVDDYLFDGIFLLVGEDGSVVRTNGIAVTQYVWGKIWVNNHAHVLQGKGAVSTEQLYLHFSFEPVAPYVTGAVQPKLSQGRMNQMPFMYPGEDICGARQPAASATLAAGWRGWVSSVCGLRHRMAC